MKPFQPRHAATACLLMLACTQTWGLESTISARYRGEAAGHFQDTTPPAAFCVRWPVMCQGGGAAALPITFVKSSTRGASDPRDQFFIKLPGRREIDVYHLQTGESHRLTIEFTAVGQSVYERALNYNPVFNASLQGGCSTNQAWGYPSQPSYTMYLWNIRNPQSPAPCNSTSWRAPAGYVATGEVKEMGVRYNLQMPAPYRMKPGIYTGSSAYSIGPGGDFDFGNDVTELNGNSLTINFELDVEHAFFFDFPPGSERAVLEPREGWQAWMAGGRAPQRLYRDLPFRIWSTGPFKAYKLCQHYMDQKCGIRNAQGDQVPVDVALSLPAGIQHGNQPVQRLTLPSGRGAPLQFESAMPTLNRPGQLHFEVDRTGVQAMLQHPGSTYTGQVTVVFDAEL